VQQKQSSKDMLAQLEREAEEMAKERVLQQLAAEKEEDLTKKAQRAAQQRAREKVSTSPAWPMHSRLID
jgi:hypothetical protein